MNKSWSGKTGGSKWEQQSLIRTFRYVNPRWLYPFMWIWIFGYICFESKARQSVWYYWRKRWKLRPFVAIWHLLRTYSEFGKAILDRFACWGGRQMIVSVNGQDLWDKFLMNEQAFVILASHVGNLDLAGYTIRMPQTVFAVVHTGDSDTVEENRARLFREMGITIIPIQEDGGHVLDMHRAISEGHVVSVHGDRLFSHTRALYANFLGKKARFPEGCYRFVAAEKVPVLSLSVMRESCGHYTIYVRQLSDGLYNAKNHQKQAQEVLNAYVHNLEEMLTRYPEQWFNFYDFWTDNNEM